MIEILAIGFLLGIKHALEPDHVIAVSTIVGKHKKFWRSSFLGFFWGIGHTLTLLGIFLIMTLTKSSIPDTWAMSFEMGVGFMLIYLGFSPLWNSGNVHIKSGKVKGESSKKLFVKSMAIGQIHGLAGSAAMILLALSMVDSAQEAFIYISIFGMGTILGMLAFTLLLSIPYQIGSRSLKINRTLIGATSILSIGYGLYYIYTIGFGDGLFL
ncbi:urease accessory protein UreH [Halobacillus sp. Marseille-Q1614]|uniref:urease accessory protein UreH n=1 Tax=Halobacillus sp. Marseille-Q1614 TaxID=2709134 RepID=UPI00156E8716|nr:urease accessory protein UreH [Halobacillus sp. Marseille-Q1614]